MTKKIIFRLMAIGGLVGVVTATLLVGALALFDADVIPAVVGGVAGAIAGVATALIGTSMNSRARMLGRRRPPVCPNPRGAE